MRKMSLLLVLILLLALSFSTVAPVSACGEGCTPGYWKQPQHFDSWVGFDQDDNFLAVFGVGPDITLLQALSAKRQDFASGEEAALVRHAVAALLNSTALDDFLETDKVIERVQYAWGDPARTACVHDYFAEFNELGCPLN